MTRAVVLPLLLAVAPHAAASDPGFSGPLVWREHWLVARGRLTLPPVSPRALPAGETGVAVDFDWGNDLGWEQLVAGESAAGRRFLVDGEHRTLTLEARRGLGHGLDLAVRIPLEWRGGGILDGVIDWFHGFTRALGLPDNGRRSFARDLLRVDLRQGGERLAWDDRPGAGLGRVEVSGRWSFVSREGATAALVARASLPSGTGPFSGGGPAVGLQGVGSHGLGSRAEAFAGLGATFSGETLFGGVEYARMRPEAFLAVEGRLGRRWSVVAQSNAAGRLIDNVDDYPGLQWYLSLGGRVRLDSGWGVEGGFTENLANQQATTDFGVQARVTRTLGSRR